MAIEYREYVIEKIEAETDEVRTFRLAPVQGEVPVFEEGQFFNMRITRALGVIKPNFRSYSVLAPHAPKTISFGVKLEGAFTHFLFGMREGDAVELAGPFGKFVMERAADGKPGSGPAELAEADGKTTVAGGAVGRQEADGKTAGISNQSVFLAGGIGITPLHCMAAGFTKKKGAGKSVLFYSNREEGRIAYRKSLDGLHVACPDFEVVYTLTGERIPESWMSERGRIDRAMLKRHGVDFAHAHFYLCGSPAFVKGAMGMLAEAGVEAARMHKEQW
ncbi:MAG: FAD-binding oxidoreductase [Candidatus Micrarchaeota archaeon]